MYQRDLASSESHLFAYLCSTNVVIQVTTHVFPLQKWIRLCCKRCKRTAHCSTFRLIFLQALFENVLNDQWWGTNVWFIYQNRVSYQPHKLGRRRFLDEFTFVIKIAMFIFFLADVKPVVRQVLRRSIGPCVTPQCAGKVDLVEAESTLRLFFVPVWSFSSRAMVRCSTCDLLLDWNLYKTKK